jgi:SAM-dependent methyltransferase
MDSQVNLHAYEGVEVLSNYLTRGALETYRRGRLERYAPVVRFIRERAGDLDRLAVAEVGSGSTALLYALAGHGALTRGMGVELSRSRWEFAELWKADGAFEAVHNVNADFTTVDFGRDVWDWFVVIDNTFTYLYPEDEGYPAHLLRQANAGLKAGGRLMLDFINYAKRDADVDYRQWSGFPPTDPYAYGLYSNRITDGINRSETTFIKRDGSESRKIDLSKVYSLPDITRLLETEGFAVEEVLSTFDGRPFVPAESDRMLVVARTH